MNEVKLNWITENHAEMVLNRPEMKNAVNFAMIDALEDTINKLEQISNLKGVLIRGEGYTFCSGGDLLDFHTLKAGKPVFEEMLKPMTTLLIRIKNLSCPVVSLIEGAAVGGGAELASAADRLYVTPGAKFGFIQVKLGIRTGWGGESLIKRHLDQHIAEDMLRTGRILNGYEVSALGLTMVHEPCREKLFEGVSKMKADQALEEKMFEEAEECATMWGSSIHGEKISDFLEKKNRA